MSAEFTMTTEKYLTSAEVWVRAWCASISTDGMSASSASVFADVCVADFEKRFAAPTKPE